MKEHFKATLNELNIKNSFLVLTISSLEKDLILSTEKAIYGFCKTHKKSLPTKEKIITVNKSPSGHNKSKEQFSLKVYTSSWIFPYTEADKTFSDLYCLLVDQEGLSFKWLVKNTKLLKNQ